MLLSAQDLMTYVCISQTSVARLQLVSELLTNAPRREHVRLLLHILHQPPDFNILLFVPNGLDPPCLSEILIFRKQNRVLRSSRQLLSDVLRSRCEQPSP